MTDKRQTCTARPDNVLLLPHVREPATALQLDSHATGGPGRASLEHFVHEIFYKYYHADIKTFYPNLVSVTRTGGSVVAVAGIRSAQDDALFAEQYLDLPAEVLVSQHAGRQIRRDAIVEVGNLAPAGLGQARWLIAAMTSYLHAAGFQWVIFTAVPTLVNAFRKMGLQPTVLARADAGRLACSEQDDWGSYYDANPLVCTGSIERGFEHLNTLIKPEQIHLRVLIETAIAKGKALRPETRQPIPRQQSLC